MRANERTDERVAQYIRLHSCLFLTAVARLQIGEKKTERKKKGKREKKKKEGRQKDKRKKREKVGSKIIEEGREVEFAKRE